MNTQKLLQGLPHLPPLSVSTALLASEVPEVGLKEGGLPEWVKVTPRGPAQTRDGRRYNFTPETLVQRFKADGIDLPADTNHAIAVKGAKGEVADAIGWVKEIEARPDGTYARIEWLPAGKAVLAAQSHRYVSPAFHHDTAGEATWLHSVSLVGAPAIPMPALAAAQLGGAEDASAAIRATLGLAPGADAAACLAAIGALQADSVPLGLYIDTVATLNATNAALSSQRGEARAERVERMLGDALKSGKLFPCERPHYEALCSTDAGLERIALLLTSKPTHGLFAPSRLDGREPDRGEGEHATALAQRASRYRQAQAAAGIVISQTDAIAFCHANPGASR